MSHTLVCRLDGRRLLSVTGADAADYLGRLITQRPEAATAGAAAYGALLTPQGKIISDFLMVRTEAGFLLDCPEGAAADLMKRLLMFRLRAAVAVDDVTQAHQVIAAWGGDALPLAEAVRDPRHPELGWRAYPAAESVVAVNAEAENWHDNRIALAIAEFGRDAPLADTFPHDIAMDCLNGVDFAKGCYVGQEVVSRMRYRGTARRRPLAVVAETPLEAGVEITADGRTLAVLGSAAGRRGVAIARLDKVADAVGAGRPILAGGVPVRLDLPLWADYGWPKDPQPDA